MLRDSDGDIGGGKFVRSGSYALSFYLSTLDLYYLLWSHPILFDRIERLTLGKCAEKGTASRNLQAPGGEILFGSPPPGCHYSSRTVGLESIPPFSNKSRSLVPSALAPSKNALKSSEKVIFSLTKNELRAQKKLFSYKKMKLDFCSIKYAIWKE